MTEPRGISKKQAAAYAGCESLSAFTEWVRRGIMPKPIPGTRKWDRKAIDAALDRLSGLQPKIEAQVTPYDAWKASQNAGAAERDQPVHKKAR
ncbi:helix-turn-helix transcriptional regulator [Bradyrhizobium sp. PMVTL-01]|uniref:helix-turn-helix transcriptional regulator n=1 Tax=Bradyrhizobium sp. PMVTL-01 TaxID=3434999 RepID=UPI003F7312BC